jgi:hypothetical protein
VQESHKRHRADLPGGVPEQSSEPATVKQEPSVDPVRQAKSTDVVVRREGGVLSELPTGERHVVPAKKDPSLLSLTYEEYLEVYERVEAAWRLRKVEDLFMGAGTQNR